MCFIKLLKYTNKQNYLRNIVDLIFIINHKSYGYFPTT